MNTDLLNAVWLDGRTVAVGLEDGRISAITPVQGPARAVILPLPVEPHVHLDKNYTIHRCNAGRPDLFGAIDAMRKDAENWTAQDLRARMERGLTEAWENGVSALRSHVDWTGVQTPLAWTILGEIAAEWQDRIHVQRASLASLDLLGDADIGPEIAAQVAQDGGILGCFIYLNDDLREQLRRVFDLAETHGLRLDFHVDEGLDPEATGFDAIVDFTARYDMGGRVLCGHACSLSIRPKDDVARVMDAAARAGVTLTVLPTTNLHLQDMVPGRTPRYRGLAPMHELRAAGVEVVLGTDNVRDPFYPYGAYDPIETLRLATLAAHLEPAAWLEAITTAPARAMGLSAHNISMGERADFILIEGADWTEALCSARSPRHICRAGRALISGKAA